MGETCNTHGRVRNAYKILIEKYEEDLGRRGEDNNKMDLKQGVKVWTDLI
jgi:hypothetical protein